MKKTNKQQLKPIMFVGTGSDVGKSVINAAFCRIFKQDGYTPAPFKAQNMSLNSYATADGLEIGRAQAVQAEACGIECRVEMNPVLLKPTNNISSQVVLHGKPIGNMTASEYFIGTDRDLLFKEAMISFNKLHEEYNPIVIEGAGSISEINLWDKDITNMRVALDAEASVFLIADIDRGGIFASVYGSIQLLPPNQKERIKGIIINKFRGDIALFQDGKKILEEITGKPVVGIIPYFREIFIEQEDSVVLDQKINHANHNKINIAVVLLKHMSNFTDFNILEQNPNIHLYYATSSEEIAKADIILLPGTKNTIADMQYLREGDLAQTIIKMHKINKPIYGICGGYQMMGMEIRDPHHIEGSVEMIPGLGILPIITTLTNEKKTEQCTFSFLDLPELGSGYEIHMGQSVSDTESPLCKITNGSHDGYFLNQKTWGTYIHGIFDNPNVINYIIQQINPEYKTQINYKEFKKENYDKLADLVRNNIDIDYIYQSLSNT